MADDMTYEAPTLTVLGTVSEMTLGSKSKKGDQGGGGFQASR